MAFKIDEMFEAWQCKCYDMIHITIFLLPSLSLSLSLSLIAPTSLLHILLFRHECIYSIMAAWAMTPMAPSTAPAVTAGAAPVAAALDDPAALEAPVAAAPEDPAAVLAAPAPLDPLAVAAALVAEPPAAVVEAAEPAGVVAEPKLPAGAVAAHEQTSLAEFWTRRPVWIPQPLSTQEVTRAPMATELAEEHWHLKSAVLQPTAAAAERRQVC
jgi:hypothetical protein